MVRAISSAEIESYNRDGVVWLNDIIDPAWAEFVIAAITDLRSNPDAGHALDFTGLRLAAESEAQPEFTASGAWADENREFAATNALGRPQLVDIGDGELGHFLSVTGAFLTHPMIREVVAASPLGEVAATLMGSRRVFVYGDQVLVKPPRTAEKTVWHQDLPYNHVMGEQVCAVRLPCQVETDDIGPVSYVAGSHADGTVYKVNFFISDGVNPEDDGADVPEIGEGDPAIVTCYPKPGDLVVHHLRTLHAGGANVSDSKTRQAITVRYCGDDARRRFRKFAPPQDMDNLQDGDSFDQDPENHPMAWPRA